MPKFIFKYKSPLQKILSVKLAEAFLIILSAIFLIQLINLQTEKLLLQVFFIFAARIFLANLSAKIFFRLSLKIQFDLRKKLHEIIFSKEISSGELLTIIFDTLQVAEEFFMKVAPNIFSIIILLPIFLIAAIFTDKITAIILFVTLPIAPIILFLIGKVTSEKNLIAWNELQKLNSEFKEILSAITALKIFDRINFAAQKIKSTSQKSSVATLEVLKFAFISSFALELITTLSIALVAVTLGLRLVSGDINFDAALFLLIITPEFFLPIRKLGISFHIAVSAKTSADKVRELLYCKNSSKIISVLQKFRVPPEILVENLSFTYPQKKSPALREINLKIPAGKITAITGESGAGKSTLLKILAGLYLPTEGEIFFNDLPSSKMQRESLLQKISYAPQSPHLFDTTLAENFSMFNQLDIKNLQKFLVALNLQNLNLFAEQKLSRGQLQRLGIIRALLKDSAIILLDEPTAGLDEITEQKVLNLLKKISARKTIIIATHRQAVINFSDLVLKIQVGEYRTQDLGDS